VNTREIFLQVLFFCFFAIPLFSVGDYYVSIRHRGFLFTQLFCHCYKSLRLRHLPLSREERYCDKLNQLVVWLTCFGTKPSTRHQVVVPDTPSLSGGTPISAIIVLVACDYAGFGLFGFSAGMFYSHEGSSTLFFHDSVDEESEEASCGSVAGEWILSGKWGAGDIKMDSVWIVDEFW